MSTTPGNLNYASAPYNPDTPPSRSFAYLSILVTVILLLAMLSVLMYRSLTQRAPTAVMIVQGDPQWDGTHLVIEGGQPPVRQTETLDRKNKYTVTFFLQPGDYTLEVSHTLREPLKVRFQLTEQHRELGLELKQLSMRPPYPGSQPTGAGDQK